MIILVTLMIKSKATTAQHGYCCKCGLTLYQWAFYRYQHQPGRTSIAGLLFVNFYFYNFIGQRFRAGRSMNSTPAAIPVRQTVKKLKLVTKTFGYLPEKILI